jgi:hypothetical protein
MLDLLEGGFIADLVLYLSYFYTSKELPFRLIWFWVISTMTNILGAFLPYGILHLQGVHGWAGWWYMFLIEAMLTGIVGIISFWHMPASPYQTKGRFRGPNGWFTERQETIQANIILRDDPSKGDMHNCEAVGPKGLLKALKIMTSGHFNRTRMTGMQQGRLRQCRTAKTWTVLETTSTTHPHQYNLSLVPL